MRNIPVKHVRDDTPLWEQHAIPVDKALQLFGISVKNLRRIIHQNRTADYLEYHGGHVFIVIGRFSEYLNSVKKIGEKDEGRN